MRTKSWTAASTPVLVAGFALVLGAGPAAALPTYCNVECNSQSCCQQACTDPETFEIITCQEWGSCYFSDLDCDSRLNIDDNCDYIPNYDQDDCDGDGSGDVCDSQNATYQYVSNSARVCRIQGFSYYTGSGWGSQVERYWEGTFEDVSSCGASDIYEQVNLDWEICEDESDPFWCCYEWFGYSQCSAYYNFSDCRY